MATGPTIKTKFFIGPANPDIDWTSDSSASADFAALTYKEVRFVETAGDIGADQEEIVGRTLNQGVVRFKGDVDAGAIEITCFRDALDPGQVEMVAAASTYDKYAVKIELNDKPPVTDATPSTFFMVAAISMPRTSLGGTTDITRRIFRITPSKAADVLEIPATEPVTP